MSRSVISASTNIIQVGPKLSQRERYKGVSTLARVNFVIGGILVCRIGLCIAEKVGSPRETGNL